MPKKLTTQDFVLRAKKVHGDRYDYSLTEYENSHKKIKIICKTHGIFEQIPDYHINQGCGCKKCTLNKFLTTYEFIKKSKKIHGEKYDYSLVIYKSNKSKVEIMCKTHGVFKQTPHRHLLGSGCQKCAGNNKMTSEDFIKKSKKIHGDKYDYSLSIYTSGDKKITITCPIHGNFLVRANSHTNDKVGCKKCSPNYPLSKEEFIKKANLIHNFKYNYFLVNYKTMDDKVIIICPKHGNFKQKASKHLKKHGCIQCSKTKKLTTDEFVNKSKLIHGEKYDYSVSVYKNNISKIKIICKKHGIFEQVAGTHLAACGCPICKESVGEKLIRNFLNKNNICFLSQHKFNNCKDKGLLPFDFYLPKSNCCIEFNGIQHYSPISFFGGDKSLEYTVRHDKIKKEYCNNNNILLIVINEIKDIENKLIEYGVIQK